MVTTTDPAANTLSKSDKLLVIPPITCLVPIKLDVDKSNYSSWCFFFKTHCEGMEVLDHIQRPSVDPGVAASSITLPTPEWLKVYSLVKSCIFFRLENFKTSKK